MRLSRPNPKPDIQPLPGAQPVSKRSAIVDVSDGSWEALVKARETRALFHALPRERREAFYRLHDQLVVGLSGAASFDPATVSLGTLQAWIWASANDESDAQDLQTALHVLLALAVEKGLRPSTACSCWPRTAPLPSTPTH